ncbi:HEAT repeat domain-containing protein [Chloroflexota bacterium]
MPLPFEDVIIMLGDNDQPLPDSILAELSTLNSEELDFFKRSWITIESKRRYHIIHRLLELAENNFELSFDNIFKYCLEDQDAKIRSKAIEGLWENEEASLINPLVNLLEQDISEEVQAAAAKALSKFAMLAECNKLRPSHTSKIQKALLAVINDTNKPIEVRRRTLEAAAPMNLPQVKTAITEAYQSHDSRLRLSSIYAMGKNYDPSWLPILLKELASTDTEMFYEAAGACGELEEEEAIPHLRKLVNNTDTDVQMAAIQALGKIGGAQAKECLEHCLNNTNQAIRQVAEQILHELEINKDSLSFPL